jgi:hypothetical protein
VNLGKEISKVQQSVSIGKVDRLLSALNKEDSKSLIEAMSNLDISSRVISKVLKDRGYAVGRSAVDKWRHDNVPNYETRSNHFIGDAK